MPYTPVKNAAACRLRRARWVAAGLCSAKGDGPAVCGQRCRACADQQNAHRRARTIRRREERDASMRVDAERNRDGNKQRYDRRRAAGICTRCGKLAAESERTTCAPCGAAKRTEASSRNLAAPQPRMTHATAKAIPKPSSPLGLPPPQVSRLGWCPQNLALSLVWAMKREEAKRA